MTDGPDDRALLGCTPTQIKYLAAVAEHGGIRAAARALGVDHSVIVRALKRVERTRAAAPVLAAPGAPSAPPIRAWTDGVVRRYLLTAAQDNTAIHAEFWRNLHAYAEYLGAEVRVGGFTYQKGLFEDHSARSAVFAAEVQPFLAHERVDLGPVVFCAEMNILPTATRPLSGLESYTSGRHGVFPHAKVQLISVPTIAGRPATQLMTTGAVTLPNYVAKKAGLKAAFHHILGATLVEIDSAGRPFMRQINATDDGAFQDLDVLVFDGECIPDCRVEAITWGDIHEDKISMEVARAGWGLLPAPQRHMPWNQSMANDNMIDVLRPRYQFFHDLMDFNRRNHHRIKDPHHRFEMVCKGTDRVEDEVEGSARFLRYTERDFCQSVVIESNHDNALMTWLKTADYRDDAVNAEFFLRCQVEIYAAIKRGDRDFNIFRHVLAAADPQALDRITFVTESSSFVICPESGGIECSQHGHLGLNGARGSPQSFTKMAVRLNTAHTHVDGILDGVYTAGLSGRMDQGYNRGPSSWSWSHIVTYPSGKRSIVTMQDDQWRAAA